jgi:hypothetical protein
MPLLPAEHEWSQAKVAARVVEPLLFRDTSAEIWGQLGAKATDSTGLLVGRWGSKLHPSLLSLAGRRRYRPFPKPIVRNVR